MGEGGAFTRVSTLSVYHFILNSLVKLPLLKTISIVELEGNKPEDTAVTGSDRITDLGVVC